MKYTIQVNEEISFDLYYDNGKFYIDDHNFGIQKFVKLGHVEDRIDIFVLHKRIAYIDMQEEKIIQTGDVVTSTELRAYHEIVKRGTQDEASQVLIKDVSKVSQAEVGKRDKVETELHTHFMEMLTGEDFLGVILAFVDSIPVDSEGHLIGHTLDGEGKVIPFEECIGDFVPKHKCDRLARELSLPVSGQRTFDDLSDALSRRNNLVDYAASVLEKKNPGEESADYKKIVYYQLLIKSLEFLKRFGIKYVELSYSNEKTIQRILEYGKIHGYPEGIEFRFLLSANRQRFNNPRYVTQTKKRLRTMMDKGLIKGFDLMGEELPFSENDKKIEDPCSFANFINYALPLLNDFDGSVLRLHMGENRHSMANPITSLEIIDMIVNRHSLLVPPPTIRLGHGVFFDKIDGEKYEHLLKKFGVVVEINASSNFALGNVDSLIEIPYKWYKERKIPFVIATDGGGAYLTDSFQEAKIALSSDGGIMDHIRETERKIGR